MVEKRRGLGRGLGALIPSSAEISPTGDDQEQPRRRTGRPVDDVFFPTAPGSLASSTGSEPLGFESGQVGEDVVVTPSSGAAMEKEGPPATAKRAPGAQLASEAAKRGSAQRGGDNSDTFATPATRDQGPGVPKTAGDDGIVRGKRRAAAEVVDVSRETLLPVPGAQFAEVPVTSIHPNRKQPRNVFDEDDMAELVHSIREIGVLQPIVVRPSQEAGDRTYELVMGERRWRAAQEAGLQSIPAIIRSTDDDALLRDALLENLHRSQLNPLEEAAAYRQLLDDFGCSHDELAERIGRSRPQISNTLRLMKLPPLVQRRLAAGVLSAGHARALLALEDHADMEKMAQKIVAEGLSVRATEELVALSDGLRRPARTNKPRAGARHERLDYLESSLADRLETSVKITLGAKKGKVSIEFASVDDLNRIMGVLSPSSE
ncbi:ParB/RepB/Spo0J family partition protein [Arthrobacter roseus]|uniref:ParB/RepB/Spo0J family partition protein n=1 Tax=Arthrobacter roseus TaxID=136274 RepID=UPI0019658323|nr:ParB/RepB/Spo0J family partition protein [Arthrobacter roseus]MBM7847147.1 ParB family chromosome partitioning protein [Arthrobacter roseus]